MPSFDVSSIGFYVLDILGRPVDRIPEGGGVDFIDQIRMTVAGTAGATAVDCAVLGLNTRAVATVGDDELGDFLVNKMRKFGIDCDMVSRDGSVQTSATILPIRPDGERPALHVRGSADQFVINPDQIEKALDASIVHVGGTGLLARFDGKPSVDLLKQARDLGRITTFDLIQATPGTLDLVKPMLPYVDYFMPSIEEASALSGLEEPRATASFFKTLGARNVLVTMGSNGVYVSPEAEEDFLLPAHKIDVVDTTGAGDSFSAGIIVGLTHGWRIRECAEFATAVAAKVSMGLGSDGALQSFDDTLQLMHSSPIRRNAVN